MEQRGGKVQTLGFKFYRDWGNETYGDYLKNAVKKAYEDKIVDTDDHYEITKFNSKNMGNILEAIMGYSFIYHDKKEQGLKDFPELANFLENGLMKRLVEEDEEEEEEADANAVAAHDGNKFGAMTEDMVKNIVNIVGQNVTTELEKVKARMGSIQEMCAATKIVTEKGLDAIEKHYADMEKHFEAEHDYASDKFRHLEEDISEVKYIVKDQISSNKRKKDDVEDDRAPTEVSDVEGDEMMVGAQCHDMSRFQKDDIKKWLQENPDRKSEAMMPFDRKLMEDKGKGLPTNLDIMSGRLFDATVGNWMAQGRTWKPLEKTTNQKHGWYPWGTLKKHLQDPAVWSEAVTDKDI
eukprot:273536-Heterocapsa_arctica.AAC.1